MAGDTFKLRFKDLDLSGVLVSHNAAWALRVARHSYLKRDGAELEPMGAESARVTYRLTYVGEGFAARYRQLVASVRQESRGVLVDPLAGQLRAVCTGISDASRDLRTGRNAVDVTITFEEDALDTALQVELYEGPSSAVAKITTRATIARTAAAPFSTATVSVASAISKAQLFAAAANLSISGIVDLTLTAKLATTGTATDVAVAALLADPGATGARAYSAVSRLVELYAACAAADQAVKRNRPAVIDYRVAGPVSVFVLAARLYPGKNTQQKVTEILAANRLPDPLCIPAGTVLHLTSPSA